MTREDFQAQMERMSFLFDRPAMKAGAMEAWYPHFAAKNASDLAYALDVLVTTFEPKSGERHPSLVTILRTLSGHKKDIPESCHHCASGTIRFEVHDEGMGQIYERIAACDCAAGNRRAEKGMRRYSSMFSIADAQHGFGMSVSRPPMQEDAAGKGESFVSDSHQYERSMRGQL